MATDSPGGRAVTHLLGASGCSSCVAQKGGVGRFVVLFFTCVSKMSPVAQRFFGNSFSTLTCVHRALEHGLWPPADRAAAESDVAGLGSEATATFGVEWLKPRLQHSHSNESSPAKTSHFVRRPGQAHNEGSAWFLPCASLADNVLGRG